MKLIIHLFVFLLLIIGCRSQDVKSIIIEKEHYHILQPDGKSNAVLILFGGFPENAPLIREEFDIVDLAVKNKVTVVYMNYNQKLWLEEEDKFQLQHRLNTIFEEHNLPIENIHIGGFSSGGNVSFHLGNHLSKNPLGLKPKGVFLIDSPIDLVALWKASEKNIKRNFSDVSVNESEYILNTLNTRLGNPNYSLSNYEELAVFTSVSNYIQNVRYLKDTKIRMYSEPDFDWWKDNRKADADQLNAVYIEKLAASMKSSGFSNVTYIATKNKGYRANGNRHPHSWSIVDQEDFMKWLIE